MFSSPNKLKLEICCDVIGVFDHSHYLDQSLRYMNNFTYLENADGGEVGVNGAEERYTVQHGALFWSPGE